MAVQRRASNNPFSDALSAESTGGNHTPTYTSNNDNVDYYNTDEKSRNKTRGNNQSSDLPPSYEEVVPKSATREYPREKQSSTSQRSRSEPIDEQRDSGRRREGESRDDRLPSGQRSHRHRSSRESRDKEHKSDRERRHRDREGHHRSRSEKSKTRRSSSKSEPPKNVDTIDKLDVTSLFGGAFHHDGPFDACTPHRNKNAKAAPVAAFPADGPNNSIRGSTNTKDATIKYIQGREDDEDELYTTSVSNNPSYQRGNSSQSTIQAIKADRNITQFDSNAKAEPVHGSTTLGLGSSTFLDGAPAAPKVAYEEAQNRANGLNRKKSLRKRIAGGVGVGSGNGNGNGNGNGSSDQARNISSYNQKSNSAQDEDQPLKFNVESNEGKSTGNSLLKRVRSLKVGRK